MPSDLTNQSIKLNDGRTLGYAEYGELTGKVVFHFNGAGGSRLERPGDESILNNLDIRLVTTDRPGHGLSDPQPKRKLLDWADDIRQLADHLSIDKFYVMGWSAGGPHALACAYRLPERVLAGATISGWAPFDRPKPFEGMPLPNLMLSLAARWIPGIVYFVRRMMYNSIQGDPDEAGKMLVSSFPPVDRKLLADTPGYLEILVADIQEGYSQGWQGPAQEDIILNTPWGLNLEDIPLRIDIWQGEVDANVPLNQGQYLHGKIPYSQITVLPGQAHLYLMEEALFQIYPVLRSPLNTSLL
jgi:pimeloyl-ACP methyl ester carboxylesterase